MKEDIGKAQHDSGAVDGNRSRNMLFKTITVAISVVFALLVGEMIARFYYFGFDSLSFQKIDTFVPLGVSGNLRAAEYPGVGVELKPGLDTVYKLRVLRINSQGLRDKEYSLDKPPRTFRVAAVGDSYTMGHGVNIEHVYHSLLEDRLSQEASAMKYEFINFGVGGYDLLNYLRVIRQKALNYKPDMILIGFCAKNDMSVPSSFQKEKSNKIYHPKETRHPFFTESYLLYLIKNSRLTFAIKDRMYRLKTSQENEALTQRQKLQQQTAYVEECFRQLGEITKEHKLPVVIAYLITYDQGEERRDIVARLAREQGLWFVDSTPYFRGKEVRKYLFIPELDEHPNEKAHKIYADMLYDFFRKEHMLRE